MGSEALERRGRCDSLEEFLEEARGIVGRENVAWVEWSWSVSGDRWWPRGWEAWPLATLQALASGQRPGRRAIVSPRSGEEVARLLGLAGELGICIVPLGGGSGVVGSTGPFSGGCCAYLDMSRVNHVRVNAEDGVLEAGAGAMLYAVEEEANRHGLTLPLKPQSLRVASVGGMIAMLGSGMLQPGYGNIEDVLEEIEVAVPSVGLARLGAGPRGLYGPGVRDLFLGSEGSMGVVVSAVLRARRLPEVELSATIAMPSFEKGLEAVRSIIQWNQPQVVRLLDGDEAQLHGYDKPLLIVAAYDEDESVANAIISKAVRVASSLGGSKTTDIYERWLEERLSYSERVSTLESSGLWFDTLDVAARWSIMPAVNKSVKDAARESGALVFSHASHFYSSGGVIYFTFIVEKEPELLSQVWEAALRATINMGTVPTHHHGIGLHKLSHATDGCPDWLRVYCIVKRALDPQAILNPRGLYTGCGGCAREV